MEIWYIYVPMKSFSTAEAAKRLGLHRPHLQRAIAEGRVKAPKVTLVGGVKFRLWKSKDVEKARKALKRTKT
jgi:excisionase family DNA binding protein